MYEQRDSNAQQYENQYYQPDSYGSYENTGYQGDHREAQQPYHQQQWQDPQPAYPPHPHVQMVVMDRQKFTNFDPGQIQPVVAYLFIPSPGQTLQLSPDRQEIKALPYVPSNALPSTAAKQRALPGPSVQGTPRKIRYAEWEDKIDNLSDSDHRGFGKAIVVVLLLLMIAGAGALLAFSKESQQVLVTQFPWLEQILGAPEATPTMAPPVALPAPAPVAPVAPVPPTEQPSAETVTPAEPAQPEPVVSADNTEEPFSRLPALNSVQEEEPTPKPVVKPRPTATRRRTPSRPRPRRTTRPVRSAYVAPARKSSTAERYESTDISSSEPALVSAAPAAAPPSTEASGISYAQPRKYSWDPEGAPAQSEPERAAPAASVSSSPTVSSTASAASSTGGETATVFIATLPPRADIYVDGKKVGISNVAPITLTAQEHSVRVVKDNLEMTQTLTLQAGANPSVFYRLQ